MACGPNATRSPTGKVQVLRTADDSAIAQAQTAVAELRRLSSLDPDWDWSTCAVIAREWSYLEPVRTVCERDGIPVQMASEGNLSLWHLRETQGLVNWVRQRGPEHAPQRRREGPARQAALQRLDRDAPGSRGGTRPRDRHRRGADGIVHRMAGRVGPRRPPTSARVAVARLRTAPRAWSSIMLSSWTEAGTASAGARIPTPPAASTTWP